MLITLMGCSSKEAGAPKLLFLLGADSVPHFEDVQIDKELNLTKEQISVFGAGELGLQNWGKITIDWGQALKPEFVSGGVMSWAPPKTTAIKVTGDAKVPLVAYLLDARVDDQMNPIKIKVIQKWRIKVGKFEISAP